MQKEIKKAVVGILIVVGSVLLISLIVPHKVAAAEMDSTERNPGLDKVTELGTAMKMWAIGFGADIKQQQVENLKTTQEALRNDWSWSEGGRFTYPLKNAWEDAKIQVGSDAKVIKGYWQTLAAALSGLGGSDAE